MKELSNLNKLKVAINRKQRQIKCPYCCNDKRYCCICKGYGLVELRRFFGYLNAIYKSKEENLLLSLLRKEVQPLIYKSYATEKNEYWVGTPSGTNSYSTYSYMTESARTNQIYKWKLSPITINNQGHIEQ